MLQDFLEIYGDYPRTVVDLRVEDLTLITCVLWQMLKLRCRYAFVCCAHRWPGHESDEHQLSPVIMYTRPLSWLGGWHELNQILIQKVPLVTDRFFLVQGLYRTLISRHLASLISRLRV